MKKARMTSYCIIDSSGNDQIPAVSREPIVRSPNKPPATMTGAMDTLSLARR
jgi:hypothetical protein